MNKNLSSTAMVLAAGLGTRMRPLTLKKPKPLFEVGGKTMLDHSLDKLVAVGVKRVVVNCHYLADQIKSHLNQRHDVEIIISHETELLDTGGGIQHALPYFEGLPFFALNADLPWMDGPEPSLTRMESMWDSSKMDVLLLLMATEKAYGFGARGDFILDPDGHAHRRDSSPPFPYVLISAQILKPELFSHDFGKVFSNNLIWDKVERTKRLYGIAHQGTCYHVGTAEDLASAERLLKSGQGWTREPLPAPAVKNSKL